MMKRLAISKALTLAALTLAALPATAADDTSLELMAQNCGVCHGFDGREFNEAMPPLASMSTQNFATAMKAFRDGSRPAIVMDRVAKALTDTQIDGLAAYYAAKPATQYGAKE